MGVKKIVMLAILVSFVAGCAPLHPSNCHKTTALGSCSSGRWDDQDEWGEQARGIRDAINAKLDDPQKWKRKKCRLHMEFSRDGTALKISTSNGDKAYCEAIKSAAQFELPPIPCTIRLRDVLERMTDAELALQPGEIADQERERCRRKPCSTS
ncbi:tolA C-terminal family protein [Escherichia coli 1-392-07_S4_C1]